jgi:hypothetical protein
VALLLAALKSSVLIYLFIYLFTLLNTYLVRRFVAGLSPRRPGFDPGSVHVGFVVDKVALGQVFLRVLGFPLSISFHWCSITCKTW